MQMVNRNTVFDGLVAKLIGRPIVESSLDSPAGHPGGDGMWIVIAAAPGEDGRYRHPPEHRRPLVSLCGPGGAKPERRYAQRKRQFSRAVPRTTGDGSATMDRPRE